MKPLGSGLRQSDVMILIPRFCVENVSEIACCGVVCSLKIQCLTTRLKSPACLPVAIYLQPNRGDSAPV